MIPGQSRPSNTFCKAAPCWAMFLHRRRSSRNASSTKAAECNSSIHAPFGGRINKAWGLALRKRFCRSFNFELQAAATDNGLNIALAEQHSFPLGDVFHFLQAETVQPMLEQAALASPIFGTRWRWDAMRALALLRFQGGGKIPPQIQRMRSDDLLASVFPDVAACQENISGDIQIPDHPLVSEVMKDVLTEAMDLDGLKDVLLRIADGRIRCLAVDTPVPSQFSHEILNANPYAYLDDAPLEERRARAVELRRMLPESVLEEVGKLDPTAIAQVREEAWPDVRNRDELQDVLQTLLALPENWEATRVALGLNGSTIRPDASPEWKQFFEELVGEGRAAIAVAEDETPSAQPAGGRRYWIAAERARSFTALFPNAKLQNAMADVESGTPSREDALLGLVTGWMTHLGPVTASQLGDLFGLPASEIQQALLRMEASGAILRGKFTDAFSRAGAPAPQQAENHEWCDRRLLARIHRLTLEGLRRQIAPVSIEQFMRFLVGYQHLLPETKQRGQAGLLKLVEQLEGFEAPAAHGLVSLNSRSCHCTALAKKFVRIWPDACVPPLIESP